jgi:hypothetical protein
MELIRGGGRARRRTWTGLDPTTTLPEPRAGTSDEREPPLRCSRSSPQVIGRRKDRAIMRRQGPAGNDASNSPDTAPPVTVAVPVVWSRFGAPPPRCTCSRSRPSRARSAVSLSRVWTSPLGHSLGQTLPYWAVPGPTPGTNRCHDFGGFAGISSPGRPTNAMLHTREVAGSKPAAPIRKGAI